MTKYLPWVKCFTYTSVILSTILQGGIAALALWTRNPGSERLRTLLSCPTRKQKGWAPGPGRSSFKAPAHPAVAALSLIGSCHCSLMEFNIPAGRGGGRRRLLPLTLTKVWKNLGLSPGPPADPLPSLHLSVFIRAQGRARG